VNASFSRPGRRGGSPIAFPGFDADSFRIANPLGPARAHPFRSTPNKVHGHPRCFRCAHVRTQTQAGLVSDRLVEPNHVANSPAKPTLVAPG